MDMKDGVVLVIAFIAGYYLVTHWGKTGSGY